MVQLLIMLFASQTFAESASVNIVVDDFPPYINQASSQGVVTNIVKEAFALQQLEVSVEFKPWAEVEEAVDYDKKLSFMWSKTAERKQKWSYSEPVYVNKQVLVAKKQSNVFWRRLDELRRYNIGVTSHYNYGVQFENYRRYLNLTDSVSDYLSLKKLVKGKVDTVLIEQLKAQYLISFFPESTRQQLEILTHASVDTSNSYLICSKHYAKCSQLIQTFNKGLAQLKQTSRYNELINKGF